jgi:hypothetical protein
MAIHPTQERQDMTKGKTYRVTYNAPTSGPYKGFAKKPFEGVYRGPSFLGEQFLIGSDWRTVQPSEIKSATLVTGRVR